MYIVYIYVTHKAFPALKNGRWFYSWDIFVAAADNMHSKSVTIFSTFSYTFFFRYAGNLYKRTCSFTFVAVVVASPMQVGELSSLSQFCPQFCCIL